MEVIARHVEVEPGVKLATWLLDGRADTSTGSSRNSGKSPGQAHATFLFVHGLASNARLWDFMSLELARRGHLVAALDLRGHGASDKPDHGYDFATLTSDLIRVSDTLGLVRPVLSGQSLGANLVLQAAYLHPQQCRGVACVDGGTIELKDHLPDWEEVSRLLAPPKLIGTDSNVMIKMMREAHPTWPESGIQATMANFLIRDDGTVAPHLSLENHMRLLRSLWEHRPSTLFEKLQVPVLFVFAGGGFGPPDKRKAAEAARAAIPSVVVEWFEDADHDIHAQHPVELADLFDRQVKQGFFPTDADVDARD